MRKEAKVVVDGRELTDQQVGTLRIVLVAFSKDLERAIRRSPVGTDAGTRALGDVRAIHRLLDGAEVG